ncbi:hypothetical protein H4W79_004033 [Nocardiopsis terrae]|uniref:4-amino-4-deoxy-L-arabinose transferase n=1 Tax=Nocardiopsis terrae TaxID=372655 RepID=A0ABR9HL94_9ACTN|nr:hypothetical protein [Nocardiopsis terrae]MBE1459819.1 hypothetical protein [Nocardiopsis terrae]
MSPDSPTGRAEVGGATRLRRPVEEADDQEPTYGDVLGDSIAALRGVLRDRVLQAGLLIVLAALLLKVYVLSESYFVEDDFLFFAGARTSELAPAYLLELHKGHFMPGGLFLVYVQTAFGPYHWASAAGTMLLLQAASILAFLRLLWELFGRRWALLVPLTVYALAPLTIPVLGWWAAALNAVPLQLATVLALLWTVRYLRTGTPLFAWWAGGAVVFGMLFSVKALFLPALALVLAVAFLYPGGLLTALGHAFRRHRTYWLSMVAITVGYLLLYLVRQRASSSGEGASVPESEVVVQLVGRMLGEVFPTGALGGPFQWGPITPAGGLVDPPGVVLIGAWAVLVAIVLASVRVRRASWRAWALLAGYLVFVDALPTVIARGRMYGEVGSDPRYVADAALVFALVLALAFLATREERSREWVGNAGEERGRSRLQLLRHTRGVWVAATSVTLVYAVSASYSTYTYTETLSGDRQREYLANVRESLEDVPGDAGLYSRPVPTDLVLEWNGPRRLSSYVLAPLADREVAARMYTPEESDSAYVFDDDGRLVEAAPISWANAFRPEEGEECMESWDGLMSWNVWEVGGVAQVATIGYTSEEDADLVVVVGEQEVRTELPAAPEGGFWYVPVSERDTKFTLFTDAGKTCVTWASLGQLAPASQVAEQEAAAGEGAEEDGSEAAGEDE